MKQIIFIRHGEADYMTKELTHGWTDSMLTELGRKQAYLTGKYLTKILKKKELEIKDIEFYCSDLKRAEETAGIIGKEIGIQPIPKQELREFNNGIAANLTLKEAKKIERPLTKPYMDWRAYEGGETWREMNKRIHNFMNEINTSENTILIVAHRGNLIHIIHWWLRLPKDLMDKITYEIDPCSITIVGNAYFEQKMIEKLNDASHLPEDFIGKI